jgi:hypothetical protein
VDSRKLAVVFVGRQRIGGREAVAKGVLTNGGFAIGGARA